MKVVPFQIPKDGAELIKMQHDRMRHFYNHLHQHPEIQLTYIVESFGTLIAGDHVGSFSEGDLFIIGSNQPHVFRNDISFFQSKKRAESITLFIDKNMLGGMIWELPELKKIGSFLEKTHGGFQVQGAIQKTIADKMKKMLDSDGLGRLIQFLEIIQMLSQKKHITPLSGQELNKPITSFDGNRLNQVIEFSFKEFYRPISLREVASLANMTPQAFCLYFKKRTRKTYTGFLNELRIQHASRSLLEDKSIRAIAYECGFMNLSNFNRIFLRYKGITPSQFRKQFAETLL